MNKRIILTLLSIFVAALSALSITSCGSSRLKGFELMASIADEEDSGDARTMITGTKPIDSADPNLLIYDMFRIMIDEYPARIKAYARVYDSLGYFITNMADPYRKDSTVYFKSIVEQLGKVYNIRYAPIDTFTVREYGANDSIAYDIVMTVDYSGSMDGVMDAIFEGTELFVNMKDSYDRIALTSFNNQVSVKAPLSKDKQQLLNLYKTRRKEGIGLFSAVYDALWACMQIFDTTVASDIPKIMVIFSDGDDNYSKRNVAQIIERAKANKITVFTVAFGFSKDENLKYIAEYTGGRHYKAHTKKQLVAIFRDIYMSLKYYYYITYKPPEFWGYHKIIASMKHPERADTLYAYGEYDTSDLFPWDSIGKYFSRPIFFDFDSAVVKQESMYILDEIADRMLAYPKLRLEVQGHTDNVGPRRDPEGYNQVLSDNRAKAVYDELAKRGVEPRRLRWRGFGMSRPITSNDAEEGRAKNRRTEFHVLAK